MLLQPGENLFRQYYYSWILLFQASCGPAIQTGENATLRIWCILGAAIFSKILNQSAKYINKQIIPNLQIDIISIQDLLLLSSHHIHQIACWASGSIEIDIWSNLGKTDSFSNISVTISSITVSTLLGPWSTTTCSCWSSSSYREHDKWSAPSQLVNNLFLHQQESYCAQWLMMFSIQYAYFHRCLKI